MPPIASAQIVPDNTLTENTVVTPDGNTSNITGGTKVGSNLFHSFEQFSVQTGNTAFFDNAATIENIISRVTGGSVSTIDGLIRANGAASLFLINPSGIVFGPNAALNIGGSLIGSTANSFLFPNAQEFSAVDPQVPPLLELNVPVGLQYGSQSGEIRVQGPGNFLSLNPDPQNSAVVRDNRPAGLQVQPGQTLALVGGDIFLEGGNLTAASGRIELGSVGEPGVVQLNQADRGWEVNYDNISSFQDIILSQAASLDTSGSGGGPIQVQGRRVSLADGSALLSETLGSDAGETVIVRASATVEIVGTAAIPFVSGLFTDVATGATGNGGRLTIETGGLLVADGGQVSSGTFGAGNAGQLNVNAQTVELIGGSPLGPSGLFAPVAENATGNGGSLTVTTEGLRVAEGAQIFTSTFGAGDAGNLSVQADDVELVGTSPGGFPSGLFADLGEAATGDGGQLLVQTSRLLVADGAQIANTTFGAGDAGALSIRAKEIEVSGGASGSGPSGLFTATGGELGNGRKLMIETERLVVADGAQIATTTFSAGAAGNLTVQATEMQLLGTSPGGTPSGLFANVEAGATGKGGTIAVESDRLLLSEGAQISALTFGSGAAGDLIIAAPEVVLSGESFGPTGFFTTVEPGAEGSGGNVSLSAQRLEVADGAQIAVSTAGAGNAGSLAIQATSIALTGASSQRVSGLFGNAIFGTGDGGNLNIATTRLSIRDGATISASNFSSLNPDIPPGQGRAGTITIEARSLFLDDNFSANPGGITAATNSGGGGNINLTIQTLTAGNGSRVSAETRGSSDGGSIALVTDSLNLTGQAQFSTNSTGSGQAGNIEIEANQAELEQSSITATAIQAGGGDISVDTTLLRLVEDSLISTSVLDSTGGGGDITINSDLLLLEDSSISANAVRGPGGNINIATSSLISSDSTIEAASELGVDGVVEITILEPTENLVVVDEPLTSPEEAIASSCLDPRRLSGGSLVYVGQQQPLTPDELIDSDHYLTQIEPIENPQTQKTSTPNAADVPSARPAPLIEATGWIATADGRIQLVARTPSEQAIAAASPCR
ncbi:MAG: filamentous hemagglutinin N-terminal domain-containing protein [Cyanophyceae cyanobacterium]